MNATETSQIVRDPREPWDDAIKRRLEELADGLPRISLFTSLKLAVGERIHPLGIHTWVRHKRWDQISDRLIDVGVVCMFCNQGKTG